jgi:peptide/nickel transport system permease protein
MGTLEIARLMVGEASVSFLGFGVQPPDISWGLMVAQGRSYMQDAWWLVVFPGLAIFVTILSINFLGQWMRGISNPHQRQLIGKPESEHLAE